MFGAWTNLTDLKAGNTLDTLVTENGRSVVKHYLQDVGSTFGMGANGAHDWDEGWEYFYQGNTTRRRLLSFGFALSPWQTAPYTTYDSVGRFEGDRFDPTTWKPHTATTAYIEMRPDDAFWAARRVMAFTDDLIRAIVKTGQLTDAAAEQHLADVLIKRRDAIGRAYLTSINPVIDPALSAGGVLTFGNAAVEHGLATPPDSYLAAWSTFDNATGTSRRIAETAGRDRLEAPAELPTAPGSYVKVALSAVSPSHPAWAQPIDVYFRRIATGWKLVGLERMPNSTERLLQPNLVICHGGSSPRHTPLLVCDCRRGGGIAGHPVEWNSHLPAAALSGNGRRRLRGLRSGHHRRHRHAGRALGCVSTAASTAVSAQRLAGPRADVHR